MSTFLYSEHCDFVDVSMCDAARAFAEIKQTVAFDVIPHRKPDDIVQYLVTNPHILERHLKFHITQVDEYVCPDCGDDGSFGLYDQPHRPFFDGEYEVNIRCVRCFDQNFTLSVADIRCDSLDRMQATYNFIEKFGGDLKELMQYMPADSHMSAKLYEICQKSNVLFDLIPPKRGLVRAVRASINAFITTDSIFDAS